MKFRNHLELVLRSNDDVKGGQQAVPSYQNYSVIGINGIGISIGSDDVAHRPNDE